MDEIENAGSGMGGPIGLEWSDSCANIAGALALAQSELENVAKEGNNPHFKAKYADLAGIAAEVRPKLAKQAIAVIQTPYNDNEDIGVETVFMHKSGEWLKGRLKVKPVKYDAQSVGSVITYLRRYSLAAMAGVAPEDDDGEGAMGRPSNTNAPQTRPTAAKPQHQAPEPAPVKPWATWLKGMHDQLGKVGTVKALNNLLSNESDKMDNLRDASPEEAEQLDEAIVQATERVNTLKAG